MYKKLLILSVLLLGFVYKVTAQSIKYTSLHFKSGKNVLYGQISTPTNNSKPPLLVFLPGSNYSTYTTNYKRWLSLTVDKVFINKFAILNFDKPGIDSSSGKWFEKDFFELADDAINAVRYAKKNLSIDTANVFIIGHSQGGWLAQIVASRYPKEIRGAISLAGPAVSVFEQEVETITSKYLCEGLDQASASQKALQDTYKEFAYPVPLTSEKKEDVHFRFIKGYDPRPVIEKITIPILFVFAQKDEYVYPEASIESIENIFNKKVPKNITVKVIPNAAHSFKIQEKCFTGSTKDLPYSPDLETEMQKWMRAVLK